VWSALAANAAAAVGAQGDDEPPNLDWRFRVAAAAPTFSGYYTSRANFAQLLRKYLSMTSSGWVTPARQRKPPNLVVNSQVLTLAMIC
jgi:hypothetical protein